MQKINLESIPTDLKELDSWVGWKTEKRDGKETKVPYKPTTNSKASSTDPQTWVDFDTVKASPKYSVGFVFTDSPFAGVDLDGCRDPDTGELTTNAQKIVNLLDSYTEISPSGTGLHILVKGELPGDRNRTGKIKGLKELEIYDTDRYFTITGNRLENTPAGIKERNKQFEKLYKKAFSDDGKSRELPQGDGTGLDDNKVIELAKNAKNGDKFEALWNGEVDRWIEIANPDDESHSGADQALCSILAFYTGPNPKQIDRIFRKSELVRSKWVDREDYRERTITNATQGTSEFYKKPKKQKNSNSSGKDPWQVVNNLYKENEKKDARYKAYQLLTGGREFAALPEGNKLLVYNENEGTFNDYGREYIERKLQQELRRDLSTYEKNEVTGHVWRSNLTREEKFGPGSPELVCVENGILNLGNGQLFEHNPKYQFRTSLPVKYDSQASSEKLDEFLTETLREKDIPLIEEIAGYCLYRAFFIQKAFMFVGEGANGKGVTLDLITNIIGKENISGISLQQLTKNYRFSAQTLYKKYANIAGDLPTDRLGDTELFKKLTGNDYIDAEVKNSNRRLKFKNYAKLIFSTNKIPKSPDDTDAFHRRWILIDFPHRFVNDPQGENEKQRDPKLRQKLDTEKVKSAFLNRALNGVQRLFQNGRFTFDPNASAARKEWRRRANPVKAFADARLEEDGGGHEWKNEVYRAYKEFCNENGIPQQAVKKKGPFSRELYSIKNLNVESARPVDPDTEKQRGAYTGIKLIDEVPF